MKSPLQALIQMGVVPTVTFPADSRYHGTGTLTYVSRTGEAVTYLPHTLERVLWYLVNVGCLLVLLRGAWHLSGGGAWLAPFPAPKREYGIALLGLASGIYYSLDCLAHQQTDLVIGALLLAGCVTLARGRSFGAATWFGIAAGIKCTPFRLK